MIIICPCGEKKFEIDNNLIPNKGRLLQCGSCEKKWFYTPGQKDKYLNSDNEKLVESTSKVTEMNPYDNILENLSKENINLTNKSNKKVKKFSFNFYLRNFLSYLLVFSISIIALILLLDTFKGPLIFLLPNLEFYLFNLFEVLKDINLFIIDLL